MVKSNVKSMSKTRRKIEVDPDLLRKFLELVERSRETDLKVAEDLAWLRQYRKRLQDARR